MTLPAYVDPPRPGEPSPFDEADKKVFGCMATIGAIILLTIIGALLLATYPSRWSILGGILLCLVIVGMKPLARWTQP